MLAAELVLALFLATPPPPELASLGGGAVPAGTWTGALPQVTDAPAAYRTIAVLVLSGDKSGFPVSEVYGAARRPLERYTALRVAPLEAIGLEERDAAIRECAGNAACFVRRLRAARDDVDLLLTVSVDRPDEDLLLGLRLIETRGRRALAALGDEVPFGMSLEGALERRLPGVVPANVWGQVSSLEIQSAPSEAEVSVAGRICITPCTLERLLPGPYEVTLRKSGRLPWQDTVTLRRGENRVDATLPVPERSFFASPWFWAGVGAVAIAGAAVTWAVLDQEDPPGVVCFAADRSLCGSN
ncbi:MAG: PEGA domain-containing protein [Myxococcota bacterium]